MSGNKKTELVKFMTICRFIKAEVENVNCTKIMVHIIGERQ